MKIELKNVKKKFGERVIFQDINLKINTGDLVGIYGDSGKGKTTLLNIIGQIESFEGNVLYDGVEINTNKSRRHFLRDSVGFIYQNYGLIDSETVVQNFDIIKKVKKMKLSEKEEAISNVLTSVGLEGFQNRKIFTLSGGEQQRISIAKLLLKDVKLVLADEPTASLDSANSEIIFNELIKLNRKGVTVIIVSHDMDLLDNVDKVFTI